MLMKKALLFCFIFLLISLNAVAQENYPGQVCESAIQITSIPYFTNDTTGNYGDDYSGSPGSTGCGTQSPYLNGDDVVYAFTATDNIPVTITMTPTSIWSGIFVYNSCANVGVSCVANAYGSNTLPRVIVLPVTAGQTYYVVISTWGTTAATQSVGYNLTVVKNSCTNFTSTFAMVPDCANGNQFYATANVTNMGTATSIIAASNQGGATQSITSPGIIQFGPYPNGTNVTLNLQNASDPNCFRNSPNLTQAFCPATNNLCSGAIPITCGSTQTQTTVGATTGGAPTFTCGTGPGSGGLWYTYTGTGDVATFSLCGSSFNTRMQILTGSCGSFTCVGGNDDFCGLQSQVAIASSLGTVYYIYVYGSTGSQGVFNLTTTCTPIPSAPLNDNCQTAVTLPVNIDTTCSLITSGTIAGATQSSQPNTCEGTPNDDVWYQFVATQTVHTITLSNIIGSTTNLDHALFTSTDSTDSCNNLTLVYCSDPNSSFAQNLIVGQTYFIRIYSSGTTILQDTTFDLCVSLPPPPPVNDSCFSALIAPVNPYFICANIISGTITNATASPEPINCAGTADDDVWFQFIASANFHTISLINILGTTTDLAYAVYSGASCDALTQINCQQNNGGLVGGLTPGEAYFVRVYSQPATSYLIATFYLCITTPTQCNNAIPTCGDGSVINNQIGLPSYGGIGCLASSPNPFWFTIEIETSGPITYTLNQTTAGNADVDFILWGPFTDAQINSNACNNLYDYPDGNTSIPNNIIDCSYSAASTEFIDIPNALQGQHYLLLVTNFGNALGTFNINQTGGTGSAKCIDAIKLEAFVDANNNGIKEPTEIAFTQGTFNYTVNGSTTTNISYSPNGVLYVPLTTATDSFDFSFQVHPELATYFNCTTLHSDITYDTTGTNTYYFPISNTLPYSDVEVSLTATAGPNPGFSYSNKITYKNNGLTPASGTLTYVKDPALSITTISQTGTVANANGFTYAYTNLLPNETRTITIGLQTPTIPTVALGDLLTNTASATSAGDINPANNSTELAQIVTGSYDPNDKMEAQGPEILFSSFGADDYLYYTIRFQNTGTANAETVVITDLLSADLDEQSIRMLSASHDYTMNRMGNDVEWTFEAINLVPTIVNEAASQGYLHFKIKPKPGYMVGDIIPNTAQIYFDFNAPIITNTFETEFVATLGVADFTTDNLIVYPNPATNQVSISVQNSTDAIAEIRLTDMLGKVVFQQKVTHTQTTIDLSGLSKGVYMLEVQTENKFSVVKKLVKN
jgi:uncharacterized repeat protein (TIGR01451 family)